MNTPPKLIASSDWIALARHISQKIVTERPCPACTHYRGQRPFAFLFIDKKTATYFRPAKQIE
jgi:hypothetical protein